MINRFLHKRPRSPQLPNAHKIRQLLGYRKQPMPSPDGDTSALTEACGSPAIRLGGTLSDPPPAPGTAADAEVITDLGKKLAAAKRTVDEYARANRQKDELIVALKEEVKKEGKNVEDLLGLLRVGRRSRVLPVLVVALGVRSLMAGSMSLWEAEMGLMIRDTAVRRGRGRGTMTRRTMS